MVIDDYIYLTQNNHFCLINNYFLFSFIEYLHFFTLFLYHLITIGMFFSLKICIKFIKTQIYFLRIDKNDEQMIK